MARSCRWVFAPGAVPHGSPEPAKARERDGGAVPRVERLAQDGASGGRATGARVEQPRRLPAATAERGGRCSGSLHDRAFARRVPDAGDQRSPPSENTKGGDCSPSRILLVGRVGIEPTTNGLRHRTRRRQSREERRNVTRFRVGPDFGARGRTYAEPERRSRSSATSRFEALQRLAALGTELPPNTAAVMDEGPWRPADYDPEPPVGFAASSSFVVLLDRHAARHGAPSSQWLPSRFSRALSVKACASVTSL